ncbi:N-acetylneuraminate synthase [Carboxylicivirga sediminis]|uniref:N-acetylneuraminate synthase n=1 Tax=Carboxylicivirga sediminis TaxID=2006564 RepID=A0A941IZE1_9BACT|nr:N-acetylneuraminate synthase [Carboxylicivirga sediminis]MBR8537388.1 N-acetylneuraminate synthase [Carboxylicivirga sediminis]
MSKVIIIAEAGVNHNGDLALAKKLVDKAKEANVDFVKFQTGIPELLVSTLAPKAEYQKRETDSSQTQLDMIKSISLSFPEFRTLKSYCDESRINFLSTPFEEQSIDFLNDLGMDYFKVPSGEITNLPYLEYISSLGRDVILSTGMSNLSEIETALNVLKRGLSDDQISILHCTTEYPAPFNEVNLNVIPMLKAAFGLKVGYSDHTKGLEASIAAVALGAEIIEKHYTLDRSMIGPDHKASIEPSELKQLVSSIRNIEVALGHSVKKVTPSERLNIAVARKSIHIKHDLMKGEKLSKNDFIMKRPGNGISPIDYHKYCGRVLATDLPKDHMLKEEDLL